MIFTLVFPFQSGSTSPQQVPCDKGKYCDGKDATDCPIGTYNPNNSSSSQADCIACTEGFCCPNAGTIDPSNDMCPRGHYCARGTGACNSLPCPGK